MKDGKSEIMTTRGRICLFHRRLLKMKTTTSLREVVTGGEAASWVNMLSEAARTLPLPFSFVIADTRRHFIFHCRHKAALFSAAGFAAPLLIVCLLFEKNANRCKFLMAIIFAPICKNGNRCKNRIADEREIWYDSTGFPNEGASHVLRQGKANGVVEGTP